MDIRDEERYLFNSIIEYGLATREEIYAICDKRGYTYKTLQEIVYEKTGHIDINWYIWRVNGCL